MTFSIIPALYGWIVDQTADQPPVKRETKRKDMFRKKKEKKRNRGEVRSNGKCRNENAVDGREKAFSTLTPTLGSVNGDFEIIYRRVGRERYRWTRRRAILNLTIVLRTKRINQTGIIASARRSVLPSVKWLWSSVSINSLLSFYVGSLSRLCHGERGLAVSLTIGDRFSKLLQRKAHRLVRFRERGESSKKILSRS